MILANDPIYLKYIKPRWEKRNAEILGKGNKTDNDFMLNEFKVDHISPKFTAKLLKSFTSIPKITFKMLDFRENYIGLIHSPETIRTMTNSFLNFDFKKEQLELIKLACEKMRPTIESCFGTGFRVISARGFQVLPGTETVGPNKMHTEKCFPEGTHKVLLYLTEAAMNKGTTYLEYRTNKEEPVKQAHIIGSPGTYVLFSPVDTPHMGIPPKDSCSDKCLLEMVIVPSYKTEINPTFNGTNAIVPIQVY